MISGNNSNENVAASSSAATTVIYESPDSTTPKIPKLNLPKYSGDPKKFHEWWDQYEVIHNNSTISPVNKFRHLKTLLEGQALTAIAGIQVTGANYENAIEILRDRFAQRNIIVNSHMEALLNLQKVFSEKDVKALRKLYDHIEINVRSLKSLGIDFAQYGTLLIPMVRELDQVLANLKIELEAREACAIACGQLHVDRQSRSHFKASRSSFSQWLSVKPLIADFCSSSPYLKLYDLGPVETKLLIPLPEISSVILPSILPVSMFFVLSSA